MLRLQAALLSQTSKHCEDEISHCVLNTHGGSWTGQCRVSGPDVLPIFPISASTEATFSDKSIVVVPAFLR